jgi:putative salt-induced outer membrane protein
MLQSDSRWVRPFLAFALAVSAVLFCPSPGLAQDAPAPAPAPAPPPPAREGSAEFAFIGTTGNASTQTLGLGGEVIVRPTRWVVRNKAAFMRNESESELTAESFQYLFRAERVLSARASAFGEYTYFRDEFAGIEHRNAVLGGVSYKLVERAAHLLSVDGGLGYLNEQRLADADVSSATYGLGAAYRWTLSPTAELIDDVRFTGIFDDADDWRVDQTLAIVARLTSLFSLKASYAVRYANAPVAGFKHTDTNTAVALVAKF